MINPASHPQAPASSRAEHGDGVLSGLLEAVEHAAPDALGDLLHRASTGLGAGDCVLYLVDYEQRLLIPFPLHQVDPQPPLAVDGTLAGRAYRTLEMVDGDSPEGRRLWVPVTNGSERLGVLDVHLPEATAVTERLRRRCRHLAQLAGEMVVSARPYGDAVELTRRLAQVSLPGEIQRNLLPPLTMTTAQATVVGALEPAYRVAGDAFDYALNGDLLHFAVFDAMGHGLQASLLVSVAVAAYRHSRRSGHGLTATYLSIDSAIAEHFGPEHFVTAMLGQLDTCDGTLRLLNAGHPAPLLLRDHKVIRHLCADPALPVGFHNEYPAEPSVLEEHLQPGDQLLAFTDGVIETRSPAGELFGVGRLGDLLERESNAAQPPPETIRRLTHALLTHRQDRLEDDATLLFIHHPGTHHPKPPCVR